MAQFSLTTLWVLMMMSAGSASFVPHIVGGGYNTKHYPPLLESVNSLLTSALSDTASSKSAARHRAGANTQLDSLTNEDQDNNAETEDNQSASYISADNQFIRVRLPPAAFSGTDQVNPFIRRKREACQMTGSLTQTLSQMFFSLNSTMFLGIMPQQSTEPRIPADQPTDCPLNADVFSSSTEERLRSTCPWSLIQRDLGVHSFPRYVAEAACMCTGCIGSVQNACKGLDAPVTYFLLHSCQGGIALMVKKTMTVQVGCFCARPAVNNYLIPDISSE